MEGERGKGQHMALEKRPPTKPKWLGNPRPHRANFNRANQEFHSIPRQYLFFKIMKITEDDTISPAHANTSFELPNQRSLAVGTELFSDLPTEDDNNTPEER